MKSLKVSQELHDKLKVVSKKSGMKIQFIVEEAIKNIIEKLSGRAK